MAIARRLLWAAGLAAAAALCGPLAAAPPAPQPTIAVLDIQAAADINPDPKGAAAPVGIRLYQLTLPDGFEAADFFALYRDDGAALGAALRGREELVLAPGRRERVSEEMKEDAHYIGVLVAYRDIDHASWRLVVPVPANKTTTFAVELAGETVRLAAAK